AAEPYWSRSSKAPSDALMDISGSRHFSRPSSCRRMPLSVNAYTCMHSTASDFTFDPGGRSLALQRIRAAFMRGGTSKAVIFRRDDLPADKREWDAIFLAVLGSPDPHARQLDG